MGEEVETREGGKEERGEARNGGGDGNHGCWG